MKVGDGQPIRPDSLSVLPLKSKLEKPAAAVEKSPGNSIKDSITLSGVSARNKSAKEVLKRVALVAGGIAAGTAFATAGALAVGVVTKFTVPFILGAMPQITVPEELGKLLGALYGLSLQKGPLMAAISGGVSGALIGFSAGKPLKPLSAPSVEVKAAGIKKVITRGLKKPFQSARDFVNQTGAEIRKSFGELKAAETFREAVDAGVNLGSVTGGSLASVGGRVQGLMAGFAVGTITGLPVLIKVPRLEALLPFSFIGAVAGGKLGAAVASVAGSALGSAAGTLGAGVYYGIKKLGEALIAKFSPAAS